MSGQLAWWQQLMSQTGVVGSEWVRAGFMVVTLAMFVVSFFCFTRKVDGLNWRGLTSGSLAVSMLAGMFVWQYTAIQSYVVIKPGQVAVGRSGKSYVTVPPHQKRREIWKWELPDKGDIVRLELGTTFTAEHPAEFVTLREDRKLARVYQLSATIKAHKTHNPATLAAAYRKHGATITSIEEVFCEWLYAEWRKFVDTSPELAGFRTPEVENEKFRNLVQTRFEPKLRQRWGELFELEDAWFTR